MAKQNSSRRPAGSKPVSHPSKGNKTAGSQPGDGLLGWLGRQVGHVKKAVQTDVTKPPPAPRGKPAAGGGKASAAAAPVDPVVGEGPARPAPASKVLYRDEKIEDVDMPNQPGVKLRRTVIDELIVEEEGG